MRFTSLLIQQDWKWKSSLMEHNERVIQKPSKHEPDSSKYLKYVKMQQLHEISLCFYSQGRSLEENNKVFINGLVSGGSSCSKLLQKTL